MDGLMNNLFGGPTTALPEYSPEAVAVSLLLAFVMGQLIAWVYIWTHSGISYSKSFTQSLVLMTVVVSLVMFIIGNSIITAFGLIGALAIIRFRNVLKDTRDTVFVFYALVLGMALGSQRYMAAFLGTAALVLVAGYLHITGFGARGSFDGHLSCRLENEKARDALDALAASLRQFCRKTRRITVREGSELVEHVYQVRLRDRARSHELVSEIQQIDGVGEVALALRDELIEL